MKTETKQWIIIGISVAIAFVLSALTMLGCNDSGGDDDSSDSTDVPCRDECSPTPPLVETCTEPIPIPWSVQWAMFHPDVPPPPLPVTGGPPGDIPHDGTK